MLVCKENENEVRGSNKRAEANTRRTDGWDRWRKKEPCKRNKCHTSSYQNKSLLIITHQWYLTSDQRACPRCIFLSKKFRRKERKPGHQWISFLLQLSVTIRTRSSISGSFWASLFILLSKNLSTTSNFVVLGNFLMEPSANLVESLLLIALSNLLFSTDSGWHSIRIFLMLLWIMFW